MRVREAIVLGWVASLGGCGLVLDLQEPDPDAGVVGMDARVVAIDAGEPPPPACSEAQACSDDGDACTVNERCVEGRCLADAVTCDDGIDCTVDSCDPSQGCTHRGDDSACAEALPDGDCRVARCDPVIGCVLEPSDARCDDGFACTVDVCGRDGACTNEANDERCALGVALASECDPINGEAGSGCTPIECTSDDDCVIEPTACARTGSCVDGACRPELAANDTACDDGLFCTTASSCQSGICVGSTRRSCSDGDACTADTCVEDAAGSICVHEPDPAMAGAACDDGLPCTGPGTCGADGTCAPGLSTCVANAAMCQVAACTEAVGCVISSPCAVANRLCVDGACSACAEGFEDCDGVLGCECARGLGRGCVDGVCTNVSFDGGAADASVRVDGAVRPDAGGMVARDAAVRDGAPDGCVRPDVDGVCAAGFEDCDDDGCCECDRSSHFCGIGVGGDDTCVRNMLCTDPCSAGQVCCYCTGTCAAVCPCADGP